MFHISFTGFRTAAIPACDRRFNDFPTTSHRVPTSTLAEVPNRPGLSGTPVVTSLSLPVTAQDKPLQIPPAVVGIIQSLNLTDAQQASIKEIIAGHQDDMQLALQAGDPATLRDVLRPIVEQIVTDVLTPNQRKA